jgi:hypothetical protein
VSANGKIGAWFAAGVVGLLAGAAALLLVLWEGYSEDTFIFGVAIGLVGWSAMLVAIIGKGVELGVRSANDE